jgi:hypothetical protein
MTYQGHRTIYIDDHELTLRKSLEHHIIPGDIIVFSESRKGVFVFKAVKSNDKLFGFVLYPIPQFIGTMKLPNSLDSLVVTVPQQIMNEIQRWTIVEYPI